MDKITEENLMIDLSTDSVERLLDKRMQPFKVQRRKRATESSRYAGGREEGAARGRGRKRHHRRQESLIP